MEISPEDAAVLGIQHYDWVEVSSRRGEFKARVKVTDRSQAGKLFMTFHHKDTLTNVLASSHRCRFAGTLEYQSCAVHIEPWRG